MPAGLALEGEKSQVPENGGPYQTMNLKGELVSMISCWIVHIDLIL